MNDIQTVHLIFKTHLDVGFTDFAHNVLDSYCNRYIPAAIRLARQLRETREHERFIWTTGSWLIYEYLERADAAERKVMEDAIAAGDIVWHGLPFTTHSELMDASLFRFGISLSQTLDRRFGKKTTAAKMTDVPGHTRGIVPLLEEAGIQFLHIGVNPTSRPPDVPSIFRWYNSADRTSVMVMYNKGSYGDVMALPGSSEAIAFAHTGDNQGPQSAEEIVHAFDAMRARFPGARVIASTLEAYGQALAKHRDELPVVEQELGDTWIHGVGTDPGKVAQYRELLRLRNRWLTEHPEQASSPEMVNFSRWLLMIPEHTWGLDEKMHLDDYVNYDAASFRKARKLPHFQKFESSWAEQRGYLTSALDALNGTPLRTEADKALDAIKPAKPSKRGFKPLGDSLETEHFHVQFDPKTGAVVGLREKGKRWKWASPDNQLGLFRYEIFSQADYDRFYKHYNINKRATAHWSIPDFTKPGIGDAVPAHEVCYPESAKLYARQDADGWRVLAEMTMPPELVKRYGCPKTLTQEIFFPNEAARLDFQFQWFDKAACRLPEALWLSFNPHVREPRRWQMDKLGQRVSPLEVIRDGNRKLHAVGEGIFYAGNDAKIALRSLDAPLVAPGEPSLLNFNNRQPQLKNGWHFNLYNNVWGTNFPMWYEEDARFRFALEFSSR
jgi:hypothetical protein